MSPMMAELLNVHKFHTLPVEEGLTIGWSFRSPLYNRVHQMKEVIKCKKDIRLPWIHNSEPVTFHFSKKPPRKNHSEVPLS